MVGVNAVSTELQGGGYGDRLLAAVFAFRDEQGQAGLLDLQLQARRVLPVRARGRRAAARLRARAAPEGPDRRRPAGRGRARALVPALGHPDLVGDQPVAGELGRRLDERGVGRREDHVGLLELVVVERRALARGRARASPRSASWKRVLVAGVDRRRRPVVELVEAVGLVVREAGTGPPWRSGRSRLALLARLERRAASAPLPWPSSAFMLREVVVDRRSARSARAAGGRCRPGRAPSARLSSNAPAASSSSIAPARARMFSVLSMRALHREPDVGHLLADAGGGLGDLHGGLGGGVLRLDDLLLGPELVDLRAQLLLLLDQRLLLLLELGDLLVERLQLALGELLALERGAREVLACRPTSAWRAWVSSLTTCCSSFGC